MSRPIVRRRVGTPWVGVVALLGTAALVAGCSSSSPTQAGRVVTVTVPPSSSSVVARPTTSSANRTPTPHPTIHLTRLKGTCDTLLPDDVIIQSIGGTLAGVDAFVVGAAESAIGRIGYLNCRYGVTGTGNAATPKIEIGISLYATAARAAARISATVDDYTAHGATAAATSVNGLPGTNLTGGVGTGYDVPVLVVSSGQRTVAVSVGSGVATGAKATSDAIQLATLALNRTGG
jgi:hypothetical protein